MPSKWGDSYSTRCKRRKEREAKLRAKGIIEGSSKWYKLLDRR